jgi:hypothetical protein
MRRIFLTLAVLVSLPTASEAVDHSNLDEGRPLRVEDAYAIAKGEFAVELGPEFISRRKEKEQAAFGLDFIYGLARSMHVEVESAFFTDPREKEGESLDQERSGDIRVGALYNLNQETLRMPALGIKLKANLPTGLDSSGIDAEGKLIVTKSIRRLSIHANMAYRALDGTGPGERESVYEHVLGASFPVGAPRHTRTTLVADLFVEQAIRQNESNTAGAQAGIRHQLSPRVVLDAGLGSEIRGPDRRDALTATAGISVAF